jgi:hypothetical protein
MGGIFVGVPTGNLMREKAENQASRTRMLLQLPPARNSVRIVPPGATGSGYELRAHIDHKPQ